MAGRRVLGGGEDVVELSGKEAALLEAWPRLLEADPRLAMVLAPRHPERFGAVAWLLYAKMLGRTPTRSGPALAYDRIMVPILRRLERRWTPPLGQSILAVGRYRADREEIVSVPATSSGVSAHV